MRNAAEQAADALVGANTFFQILVETYRSREGQRKLIEFLEEVRSRGIVVTLLLDSGDEAGESRFTVEEIDPFTFFAVFNRGVTDANRIEICEAIKERFEVAADVPEDAFDRCLKIPSVARNLTIALFWFNPYENLSLDGLMA